MTDHPDDEVGSDAPVHPAAPGALLRAGDSLATSSSRMAAFTKWLSTRGHTFSGYDDLWRWSVEDLEGFWPAVADHLGARFRTPARTVLDDAGMPGTTWFPGATLNYAEHCLGNLDDPASDAHDLAVIGVSDTRPRVDLTIGELRDQVARAAAGLRQLGVGPGDRVVGYLPNIPETMIAFLATASIGATWASCAPEFGAKGVVDRFAQIEPTVLLVVAGYRYGDRYINRVAECRAVVAQLPTVQHVVQIPYAGDALPGAVAWADLLDHPAELAFRPVSFDHPLYVLFSSGTTGPPKAIVHGHGGIVLEHLKNHALHWDLGAGDRLLWFTTTAWMMWNALVSARLVGAVPITIDGDPTAPDLMFQWRLAAELQATLVGLSPAFVAACRASGLRPGEQVDLSRVRQVGVVGSPLSAEAAGWVTAQFGPGTLLNVGSGGTDVCTGIVQANPLTAVWAGEMSAPSLGVAATAFDASGAPVVGQLGELVITRPMPSMPVGFWGDRDGRRYRAAYFDDIPGVWRHGDWVEFSERGSAIIAGRSDATLNRGGVRLGTAEFYAVIDTIDAVVDSLVVHLEDPDGGPGQLILLVEMADSAPLDDAGLRTIRQAMRQQLSPRHVPDEVIAVPAIPRNRTGKRLEVPVKRILQGQSAADVLDLGSVSDPAAVRWLETDVRARLRPPSRTST